MDNGPSDEYYKQYENMINQINYEQKQKIWGRKRWRLIRKI